MRFEITKPTAAARNTAQPRTGFADDIGCVSHQALKPTSFITPK
jgi:hypothetical protein